MSNVLTDGTTLTGMLTRLREKVGRVWDFKSCESPVTPDTFMASARVGDICLFPNGARGWFGIVCYKTSLRGVIETVSRTGSRTYAVTQSGTTSVEIRNYADYAKAADVSGLDTRVATLESQKRWIDVTMAIENSDINHIENDIQSWNIAAMLNMSLAEIASYEGVRITDGYGQRYYLRWWFISDDTTEIRCSDFYYKGARFAAWIDDERLINLKYKETI